MCQGHRHIIYDDAKNTKQNTRSKNLWMKHFSHEMKGHFHQNIKIPK